MLLRIAVLADTHDFLPEGLIGEISYADRVWHLGDVCQPRTLAPLQEKFGSRLLVIRGNNDLCDDWPQEVRLKYGQTRFLLIHSPPLIVKDAEVVLFGHTHIPCCIRADGILRLNPGTIGKPNKGHAPGWAWLILDEGSGEFTWIPMPLKFTG